jgi:hypothetical protein
MIQKHRGRPAIGKTTSLALKPQQKAEIERLAALWDVTQSRAARHLIDIGLSVVATNPTTPFGTNGADDREGVA